MYLQCHGDFEVLQIIPVQKWTEPPDLRPFPQQVHFLHPEQNQQNHPPPPPEKGKLLPVPGGDFEPTFFWRPFLSSRRRSNSSKEIFPSRYSISSGLKPDMAPLAADVFRGGALACVALSSPPAARRRDGERLPMRVALVAAAGPRAPPAGHEANTRCCRAWGLLSGQALVLLSAAGRQAEEQPLQKQLAAGHFQNAPQQHSPSPPPRTMIWRRAQALTYKKVAD